MKIDRKSLLLYAVTDRSWQRLHAGRNLAAQVDDALRGGATFVQLREKELPFDAFAAEAARVKRVTDRYGAPFVVNDSVPVALACGADGVHIGQSDTALADARAALGPDKIIGVSASTVDEALAAARGGADYLGVGAVFPTATKRDAARVALETLAAICAAVPIPVVAIGGIGPDNLALLGGTGAAGAAVVSALFGRPDIAAAARELRTRALEAFS